MPKGSIRVVVHHALPKDAGSGSTANLLQHPCPRSPRVPGKRTENLSSNQLFWQRIPAQTTKCILKVTPVAIRPGERLDQHPMRCKLEIWTGFHTRSGSWYLVPRHFSDEWGKDPVEFSELTAKSISPKNELGESNVVDYNPFQLGINNPVLGFPIAYILKSFL